LTKSADTAVGMTCETASALTSAEAFAQENTPTEAMRELLALAFAGFRSAAAEMDAECDGAPFVHLPLNVYAAVAGCWEPALPVAAATAMLYLGLDIFDDLADGDLPAHWTGRRPAEINLVAATLLSALPQLAIARLHAPADARAAMLQEIFEGLLTMSAGQQQDLAFAGSSEVSTEEVHASVNRKSGAEMGMFAALGALLAGAPAEQVHLYREVGRAFGIAGQLASDMHDLFVAERSMDLANGTRTLPIALCLDRYAGQEREGFIALLRSAQSSTSAADRMREEIKASGAARYCAFVIEVQCRRALRLLAETATIGEPRHRLERMIASASLYRGATIEKGEPR